MTDDRYTPEQMKYDFEIPDEVLPLVLAHPRLLPGETRSQFYLMMELMFSTIIPDTELEWLTTIDLAWLQWEIQRYRRWKNAIIISNRGAALEAALCKTHPGFAMPDGARMIRAESRMQIQEMSINPGAHRDVQARLVLHGYDEEALNAGAFVRSIVPPLHECFSSARHQVMVTLRGWGFAANSSAALARR